MGVMTAPVVGSASWPAWMARVEKPGRGVDGVMRWKLLRIADETESRRNDQ